MWLVTPIGFFSVVQKASDIANNTLTIRARVRADLEALRELYLPGLGDISENSVTDYRFRAVAPRAKVAAAMADMVNALDYSNFKNQVAKVQGGERAHLYHEVWDVLYQLQTKADQYSSPPPASQKLATLPASTKVLHPQPDESGKPVVIKKPSTPTPSGTWADANTLARVIPRGELPPELNGTALAPWTDVPNNLKGWETLAKSDFTEPDFNVPSGYKRAAGVVLREPDGRFWLVAPTNEFAGYKATFPKGTVQSGMSLRATALVEAFEESGLKVRLLSHLVDVRRSLSYTRYYLAERIGGTPAQMGWESQAVMLVPPTQLPMVLNNPNDYPILEALIHVA